MDSDTKPSDQDDAFLQLPSEPPAKPKPPEMLSHDPAVELARQKVDSAYTDEPSAATEALDVAELGPALHQSRHQRFIYELTNSGKSLEEIQTAWHEYYSALSDSEKHQVWQEFYATHDQAAQMAQAMPLVNPTDIESVEQPITNRSFRPPKSLHKKVRELKEHAHKLLPITPEARPQKPIKSLLVGLGAGVLAVFILLFSFFNERFIAPLIQPSRTSSNVQLIDSSSTVGAAPEVIIPKINVEIPVVYGVNTIDDNAVNAALEQGVVHYADTALPGQTGNVVIVGHSSNNILNKGKYKFAFVLLHKLENGDIFYLQKDGVRYTYQVTGRRIVKPTDTSVLTASATPVASLITCDPPGTSTNRLVVVGSQIDPDPSKNNGAAPASTLAAQATTVPGNAPTLWSRIAHWFSE